MGLLKRILRFVGILALIIIGLLLLFRLVFPPLLRELPEKDIARWVYYTTGRDLPQNVEDIRAVLDKGIDSRKLFFTFQTDEEGCSYILDVFSGSGVEMKEYAKGEFSYEKLDLMSTIGFYQRDLGIRLFNPKDIGAADHLYYKDPNTLSGMYEVLIDKDQCKVYIFAIR